METGKVKPSVWDVKSWTLSEMAINCGVSRVMIGKFERNEALPFIEAINSAI